MPTDDVTASENMAGISRQAARQGLAPCKKVAATVLRQVLAPIPDDLRVLRARALLLTGFAGALRRPELAAMRAEQLEKTERGLRLNLPETKGPQAGAVTVPLAYGHTGLCPVRARSPPSRTPPASPRARCSARFGCPGGRGLKSALPAPDRQPAITPWAVAAIVKSRAAAAGFGRDFGGHSLKRGALITGMDRGVHPAKLKRLGRHKSFEALREYLEFGDLFEGHPLSGVL